MESLSIPGRIIAWLWPPDPKALPPLHPEDVDMAVSYAKRKHEADVMPAQWASLRRARPGLAFHAVQWITGHKEMPRVKGRLK